jgi:hypothetical protein
VLAVEGISQALREANQLEKVATVTEFDDASFDGVLLPDAVPAGARIALPGEAALIGP